MFMCDASIGTAKDIHGHVSLLQTWVWERIPILQPRLLDLSEEIHARPPIGLVDLKVLIVL